MRLHELACDSKGLAQPGRPVHQSAMQDQSLRRRHSVLYVPASNSRALEKALTLDCDAIIFDLEDAVAPQEKSAARDRLFQYLSTTPKGKSERIVRINPFDGEWGPADLTAAMSVSCDAILLPKIESPGDVHRVRRHMSASDRADRPKLWAMIETAEAVLNIADVARCDSWLDCLVVGTNDLALETGVSTRSGRHWLHSWLMQVILAARAAGLDVLDGPFNNFRDLDGFEAECAEASAMGFDGKTLIHPAQIAPANRIFLPSTEEIAAAQAIVDAFEKPENAGKGVISLDGRMVELLHLTQARRLLAKSGSQ